MSEQTEETMTLQIPWFLLPDSKAIDFTRLIWRLANKTTENESLWWSFKPCAICGERSVMFSEATGYRCEDHTKVADDPSSKPEERT